MAKQDFGASKTASSNNHVDIFYFSNFFIRKHIDLVKYSSNEKDDKELISKSIENIGYKRVSKLKLSKGYYSFKDTYKHHDDITVIDVFYEVNIDDLGRRAAVLVAVHDPTEELINFLSASCVYNNINLKVSKIELTYDFYNLSGHERIVLFDFLKSHLVLKGSRSKPSERYLTTFYANELKRSSKGLKVYLRPDFRNKRIVRLELTLKRQILKKLKITPSLKTIDSVNPFDYFLFMSVDENKLIDHLKWKSRKTHKSDNSRNQYYRDELVERHVENYVYGFLLESFSLMGKIVNLKSKESGVKGYSRFLVPHKDFTQMFTEKTEEQGFLLSKTGLN
jgi:hypothetical protein